MYKTMPLLILILSLAAISPLRADAGKDLYPSMAPLEKYLPASQAAEIALARSAGPAAVSDKAEILVLDDLGAHRVTDWVEDTVTSIVTHRCNHRKATIITTNLRDPEAGDKRGSGLQEDLHSKYFLEERIGMRARSRLYEMCRLIKMPDVGDYRKKKRG